MRKTRKRLAALAAALAVILTSVPAAMLEAFANSFGTAEKITRIGSYDVSITEDEPEYWYHFIAPEDGKYTFTSYDNTFDPMIRLYRGDTEEDSSVYSDQDSADGTNFQYTTNMFAGSEYRIQISGQYYSYGDCTFEITMEEMDIDVRFFNYDEEYQIWNDTLLYSINDDDTITIRGCRKNLTELTIPSEIDGKTVTQIADAAFTDRSSYYYYGYENPYLTSVTIPDTVTSIGYSAFRGCTALKTVKLPKNLKTLSYSAFYECSALTSVNLPDGLERIYSSAFYGCTSLSKLTIPDSVYAVGYGAFTDTGLAIEESGGLKYYDGWLFETGEYNGETEIVIKSGTKGIPDGAFTYWTYLETVTIPESVISIGDSAFGDPNPETGDDGTSGLNYLQTVIIEGNNLRYIDDYAFCGDSNLLTIDLPDSVTYIGNLAFAYTGLNVLELPENLETIGDWAFQGTNLNQMIVPESVSYIGSWSVNTVDSIVIPSTVTGIDTMLFNGYNWGKTVDIDLYYLGTKQQLSDSLLKSDGYYDDNGNYVDTDNEDDPDKLIRYSTIHYDCELVQDGVFTFVISDGEAILYRCDTAAAEAVIPAEIDGVPVTSIASGAFKYCRNLTTLDIPENIRSVGDDAFDYCSALESISFPKDVELPEVVDEIEDWDNFILQEAYNGIEDLFDQCKALTDIRFDEEDANYFISGGCVYTKNPQKLILAPETITKLDILDGTTEIVTCAVEGCTNITTFNGIPESVSRIGSKAFFNTGLSNIIVPDTVTKIGEYAFASNANLESVTLPANLEFIPNNLFGGCQKLTEVIIPDGVTEIQDEAFYNCTSLKKVVIPASVESIGYYVFSYPDPEGEYSWSTATMPQVRIYGWSGSEAQLYASRYSIRFIEITDISEIRPDQETQIYENLTYEFNTDGTIVITGCTDDAAVLDIPASIGGINVTAIDDYAFYQNEMLTGITLPDTLRSIGSSAFSGCSALTEIVIPDSVTKIKSSAFALCSSLESVTLPDTLTTFGSGAFSGCSSLESITLPDTLTTISSDAFAYCQVLTSVTIPKGVTEIGASAFTYCTALTEVNLPEGLLSIGACAFQSCGELESITFPESLTSIGAEAFNNCNMIESVVIPAGVTVIEKSTFQSCWNLSDLTLPETLTAIEESAFAATALSGDLVIPEGVTTIERSAFNSGTYESISIPSTIEAIGNSAFYSSYLTDVYYNGTKADWDLLELTDTSFGVNAEYTVHFNDGTSFRVYQGESDGLLFAVQNDGTVAITGCDDSTKVLEIPAEIDGMTVTTISKFAFNYSENLQQVTLPDTITTIGNGAFENCYSLTSVNLPDGLTSIPDVAFYGCKALTEIIIPDSVTYIGDSAFYGCTSLTELVIPDSVTEFGYAIVNYCTSLETLTIPATVESMESILGYFFSEDSALTDIYYGGTKEDWANVTYRSLVPSEVTVHFADGDTVTGEDISTTPAEETTTPETTTTTEETTTTTETTSTSETTTTTETTSTSETTTTTETTSTSETTTTTETTSTSEATTTTETTYTSETTTATETTSTSETTTATEITSTSETTTATETTSAPETTTTGSETTTEPSGTDSDLGDVDGDGEVTAGDAAEILIAIARTGAGLDSGLTDAQNMAADVNGNGKLEVIDASAILQYIAAQGSGHSDIKLTDFI